MILQVFDAFSKRLHSMFKSRVTGLYLAQDFEGEFASHVSCSSVVQDTFTRTIDR